MNSHEFYLWLNGYLEALELFDWAKYEMKYKQDELDEFVMGFNTPVPVEHSDGYMEIEKRYRKRYNKLFEDAYEVEHRHLTSLVEALSKKFKVDKDNIKAIMEEFGGTTEELYIYVEQNKYTI